MSKTNEIKGIKINHDQPSGIYICYIEDFSSDLKKKIRNMLNSIWHGSVDAEERPQFNYQNTLKRFLERYNTKTADTKKGMIGELLAHLLIPQYVDLKAISIMKNKEENSIRKGFDIVYCDKEICIWYCEVKSGGDTNNTECINQKNTDLIQEAKRCIKGHCLGNRATLWDSVLIDVNSTVFSSKKKINLKNLLDEDHPDTEKRNLDRKVILSSVLYKDIEKKISLNELQQTKEKIDNEKIFVGLILFSIQKTTYNKIEKFLIEESGMENG